MQPRRKQPPITIRSERALQRLKVLTRTGRSQAEVIEEALDRMPEPGGDTADDKAARRARIEAILAQLSASGLPTMAEFDRAEYDESGNPR
jgi:hypothetical protein